VADSGAGAGLLGEDVKGAAGCSVFAGHGGATLPALDAAYRAS